MILIYSAAFIILLTLSVIFRRYKCEYKAGCRDKPNILFFFYGLAFFITDMTSKPASHFKKPNSPEPFFNIKKKAAMLCPGGSAVRSAYLIIAKRISIAVVITMLFMAFGFIYSLNVLINPGNSLTELNRPTDGSDSVTYSLQLDTEDGTENIDIEVSKKIYEYGEVITIFDSHREELIALMLGENTSPDNISKPLNFPPSFSDKDIRLSWQPEDLSYIDYSGSLIYENISPEGTSTCIYVSMELDDVSASLMIGVTLYPENTKVSASLQSEIQRYITDNNNPGSDTVLLPASISGRRLSFRFPHAENTWMFLLLGAVSAVAMFAVASKETENKLKLRSRQMLQDYPEIVSKLLLLFSAGLNIQNAFKKIVDDYKASTPFKPRYAYEELSITLNSLANGGSEGCAYSDFGKRCALMPYIKLGVLLEQNLKKGSGELRFHLNNEVQNAFENRRADTVTKSKQAETKLILPMIMILIVIMALIIVPSFISI